MKRLYRHAQIASEDSPKLQTADVLVEGDKNHQSQGAVPLCFAA
jgi:hypothetical protein